MNHPYLQWRPFEVVMIPLTCSGDYQPYLHAEMTLDVQWGSLRCWWSPFPAVMTLNMVLITLIAVMTLEVVMITLTCSYDPWGGDDHPYLQLWPMRWWWSPLPAVMALEVVLITLIAVMILEVMMITLIAVMILDVVFTPFPAVMIFEVVLITLTSSDDPWSGVDLITLSCSDDPCGDNFPWGANDHPYLR